MFKKLYVFRLVEKNAYFFVPYDGIKNFTAKRCFAKSIPASVFFRVLLEVEDDGLEHPADRFALDAVLALAQLDLVVLQSIFRKFLGGKIPLLGNFSYELSAENQF
jgi:hypothetical protein